MNDVAVIEVVRKSVTVDCAVEEAFRIFTAEATSWWPVGSHSLYGDTVKDVVFEEHEGGEVYELTEQIRQAVIAFGERRALVPAREARMRVAICIAAERSIVEGRDINF